MGYKYESLYQINDERDNGQIATIQFTKMFNDTFLKLTHSSNVRTASSPSKIARWFFKINANECVKPAKIDIIMYQGSSDNTHIPAVLTGVCESTESSGIAISAGGHHISVHVASPNGGDAFSGYASTSFLEVQEICP